MEKRRAAAGFIKYAASCRGSPSAPSPRRNCRRARF
jgi:hypothetical protein